MRLSVWAELQGIRHKTAWRTWKAGTLPVPAAQLPTGTVVVHAARRGSGGARYARVSSADQKADLDRPLARLPEFAVSQGMTVVDAVKETGSGLNGHRKGMMRICAIPGSRLSLWNTATG